MTKMTTMAGATGKKDHKVHSRVPRFLRVQLEHAKQIQTKSCVLPVTGLYIETKLRGSKQASYSTPLKRNPSVDIGWEHQVYEFNMTEGEMYSRVVEFTVHQVNCVGQDQVVGRATLPLFEFETNRLSGVMSKLLTLNQAHVAMEIHLSVEVWTRHDVAKTISRECWENERKVPLQGWSKAHLLPTDNRPAFQAGFYAGQTLEAVLSPLGPDHVETLGFTTGPWFYAETFSGPWHNSNCGWKCRRRVLRQTCRLAELDKTIEDDNDYAPPPPSNATKKQQDLKKMVEMVDLSIEAILQKHNVKMEDY
ncbi:unnamed protein product [Aphanomyces euteiches]